MRQKTKLFLKELEKFQTGFSLKQAYEIYNKKIKKCSDANVASILRHLREDGFIKKIAHNKYIVSFNPNRTQKNIVRKEIANIFNKYIKNGDKLIVLETERLKFIKLLKKKITPIVVEHNPKRAILIAKKRMSVLIGDVDKNIKDSVLSLDSHYFLDYCDTIDKHYDAIKKISKSEMINKLLAVTFAINRHKSNYNQIAEAIQKIQDMFLSENKLARLLYAKTYKDGMPMNVICFKIERR